MKPKHKAFCYNFIGFVSIFLITRMSLLYLFEFNRFILVLIAAITASVLAPKFAVVSKDGADRVMMKWIFMKGIKQLP